ncbi:MAG: type II secretion system F family protein [Candidatus Omnitrophica bacterium]|nr:type II secretion system F family protein [Candidatus Omnitrophota bacterium]
MPNYQYKAKKGPTEIVEGEISAENEDAAVSRISAMGLIPIKITDVRDGKAGSTSQGIRPSSVKDQTSMTMGDLSKIRVGYRDLNVFTRQFAILIKASVPLLRIFEVLQIQTTNDKFRQVLRYCQEALRGGASLSGVIEKFPRIFSQIYLSMIHSGEVSGTLDKVLERLAEFAEKESEIRSRVQSALIYPVFLLLVGIGTIFILFTFVMPRLLVLFDDLGTQLPAVTQVMMNISHFCQSYWMPIVGVVAALVVWFRARGLSEGQKAVLDHLVLGLPLFKELVKKAEIARFLRSLELMYENGIPLYRGVEVAMKTVGNSVIRNELKQVPERLESGATLANSLEPVPTMTPLVINMISVGEESGQLGTAVGETATFYEQETNQFIKTATSLLEPMMILGVGVVVGFVVVSMLLPIFEIHVFAQ